MEKGKCLFLPFLYIFFLVHNEIEASRSAVRQREYGLRHAELEQAYSAIGTSYCKQYRPNKPNLAFTQVKHFSKALFQGHPLSNPPIEDTGVIAKVDQADRRIVISSTAEGRRKYGSPLLDNPALIDKRLKGSRLSRTTKEIIINNESSVHLTFESDGLDSGLDGKAVISVRSNNAFVAAIRGEKLLFPDENYLSELRSNRNCGYGLTDDDLDIRRLMSHLDLNTPLRHLGAEQTDTHDNIINLHPPLSGLSSIGEEDQSFLNSDGFVTPNGIIDSLAIPDWLATDDCDKYDPWNVSIDEGTTSQKEGWCFDTYGKDLIEVREGDILFTLIKTPEYEVLGLNGIVSMPTWSFIWGKLAELDPKSSDYKMRIGRLLIEFYSSGLHATFIRVGQPPDNRVRDSLQQLLGLRIDPVVFQLVSGSLSPPSAKGQAFPDLVKLPGGGGDIELNRNTATLTIEVCPSCSIIILRHGKMVFTQVPTGNRTYDDSRPLSGVVGKRMFILRPSDIIVLSAGPIPKYWSLGRIFRGCKNSNNFEIRSAQYLRELQSKDEIFLIYVALDDNATN